MQTPIFSLKNILTVSACALAVASVAAWRARHASAEPTQPWGILESVASASPMVSQSGGVTMMTCEGGNSEILVVLDSRRDLMLVYRVEDQITLGLLQRASVPQIFSDARAKAQGRN